MSSKIVNALGVPSGGDLTDVGQAVWPGLRFTERLESRKRQHLPTDHFAHVNFGNVPQVARLNLSLARAAGPAERPTAPPPAAWSTP
jgi:hypothetical protein